MTNPWLDHSGYLVSEIDNYRRQKGISSARSLQKIGQASTLLIHSVIVTEAYKHELLTEVEEEECVYFEIKLKEEFPAVFEKIKLEERFQETVSLVEQSIKAYLAYSSYRKQHFITGYTMETLRKYHLASKGVAPPLKSIIRSIDRDNTLYFIAPSILLYLQPIYKRGFQSLINSTITFDRAKNESRLKESL